MLLLFDIDGTLIRAGGAGRRALVRAFEALHGIPDALVDVRLDGNTDPAIIEQAFRKHLGRAPADHREVEAVIEAYLPLLSEELARGEREYQVMPGAQRLAEAARRAGRFLLGLGTGNVERGARIKLERARLNEPFTFGGFGSDSGSRPELIARGIERGQAQAEQRLGRRFALEEVLVIGDTELDVAAARAVGAVAVGVRVGSSKPEALEASKPDLLVDTLDSEVLWRRLGLA